MSAAQQAQGSQAAAAQEAGFLDQIIDLTKPLNEKERVRNKDFIQQFISEVVKPGQAMSKDVESTIKYWIANIDKKMSSQLNAIMHAQEFQKLESTWRGLHYLAHQSETGTTLKIRVMNASKRDVFKDLERAVEFDQSAVFKKVYEEEYGQLGGEPYGLLVGDYEFDRSPEDVGLLKKLAGVAAAAHAPFVSAASPKLFNLNSYTELATPRNMAKIFMGEEFIPWRSFRESEDSRYVALTMPRVLARLPYGPDFKKVEEFNFEEEVNGKDHNNYCWMNASWAYAARTTDAYAKDGWFARTRGVEGGGKVEGLPIHTFPTDEGDVAAKCPTEIAISDRREFELANLGFLPLLHCKGSDFAVFMGGQSAQKPKTYFDPANANAELSAKFNYILNTSRFSHYLKVMARDKIGSMMEVKDCEKWLNGWMQNYVVANPESVGEETKAQRPLREASVQVREVKGKPGYYEAVAYLRPHYQLEALSTSMRLVAEVPKKS